MVAKQPDYAVLLLLGWWFWVYQSYDTNQYKSFFCSAFISIFGRINQ